MKRKKSSSGKGRCFSAQSERRVCYTVDSFRDGIEIGRSELDLTLDPRDQFSLALGDCARPLRPRTRHSLAEGTPPEQLERKLRTISERGDLGSTWFFFGVSTDPFYPFEGKFDASVRFLRVFQRFKPGMLFIQTRSPLVVLPLAMLQELGKRVVVTLALETYREEVVSRYTPELPSVRERLRAASALRNFGVEVHIQIAPLLPYGDMKRDAREFAELLIRSADFLYLRPLNDGTPQSAQRLQTSLVAQSLVIEERADWLKPGSVDYLLREIQRLAPEKLLPPRSGETQKKQMSFFVA